MIKEFMMKTKKENLIEKRVTYTLEHQGRFYIFENVPARVNEETWEQYFSPSTVEKLQKTIERKKPSKFIETPVYEYSKNSE